MEVPPIRSTGMPASLTARMIPTWEQPLQTGGGGYSGGGYSGGCYSGGCYSGGCGGYCGGGGGYSGYSGGGGDVVVVVLMGQVG